VSAGEKLLEDIIANPDDNGLRLIYADWLEENGDEERAEFIRADVGGLVGGYDPALASWRRNVAAWFPPPGLYAVRNAGYFALGDYDGDRVAVLVARGFASRVRCLLAKWLEHGPALCAAHPIERVTLTDYRPSLRDEGIRVYVNNVEIAHCNPSYGSLPIYLPASFGRYLEGGSRYFPSGYEDRVYDAEAEAIEDVCRAALLRARAAAKARGMVA